MADFDIYISTPLGSLATQGSQAGNHYLDFFVELPKNLRKLLSSRTTGSFLRGLAKDFQIPLEQAPQMAFAVLKTAVGEIELPKLGAVLSAELKLPNDKAQSIAKEIEKELFSPVMLELNDWLAKRKQGQGTQPAGVKNVVDLKNQPLPKPGQFNKRTTNSQ